MKLDVLTYNDIVNLETNPELALELNNILCAKGIMGISDVPNFVERSSAYFKATRAFSALSEEVKKQYAPNRDAGLTEGYELGAEWFKNERGEWLIDDRKASYYAFVPDHKRNIWPTEVELKSSYLAVGELMLNTGTELLAALGISKTLGAQKGDWIGYGRMLHYHKAGETTQANPNWCGAHFDHCTLTTLLPARYFRDGVEVEEPEEAGLHIAQSGQSEFVKVHSPDKTVMLFQVGEFSQLASDDRIKATKHLVRKAHGDIERFAFALFMDAPADAVSNSKSILAQDPRYQSRKSPNGSITYGDWSAASYENYRAK